MPLTILHGDITRLSADAIVNAANSRLLQGSGVCGAIFAAAGPDLLRQACDAIGFCPTGKAVSTPAFHLPARLIIHTVGPVWRGGRQGEEGLLRSCYRSSLELAVREGCRSIAFPLISAGVYGYPFQEALQAAQEEIQAFLDQQELDVLLTLFP